MSRIKVAINGYGRIGRIAHRIIIEKYNSLIQVVGINAGSSTDLEGWLYLLKYDTSYGTLKMCLATLAPTEAVIPFESSIPYLGSLVINRRETVPIFSSGKSKDLPWGKGKLEVDIVIESTGLYTSIEELEFHLVAGCKRVVLSAPFKESSTSGSTLVLGALSKDSIKNTKDTVVSNASCTTNCISPVARIIEDHFGIEKAMMTTIHSFTSDQRLQDNGHKDYRRARAATENIIPATTGAAKAVGKIIPSLKNNFGGLSFRVPVVTGSVSDFTFLLKKDTTKTEVNDIFKKEEVTEQYKGILGTTTDPIVSSDIIGDSRSSIVDLNLTQVVGGNMLKVVAWYDNEFAYANRLVELVLQMGNNES